MFHPIDVQSPLPYGHASLRGIIHDKISLVIQGVLKQIDMHALADYYRHTADMFATGEFWGKIMRASCMACGYTGDIQLQKIIDDSVADMLSIQRPDGCISTVPDHVQPKGTHGSDLWERKYVLMGLLAYAELRSSREALDAALALVRYTYAQVGESPKTPITQTGWAFGGIESSSMLEPVLRVYHLTGHPDALALGRYIVESGCCNRENIFEAIRAGKSPMDIGNNGNPKESIAKAYEMMSCFEGLCEYYRATGDKWALETVELFWDKVYAEEITLLGSGGADAPFNLGPGTGEQWNRTRFEQTNPAIDLMMETCVTVYWMRLCHQLLRLTGDVKYMDALEVSLYNPILGAIRPDGKFFEYFPRFNGSRNPKVNYSFNINGFDLSCCTANGPTGLLMAPLLAVAMSQTGVVFNLYETGTYRIPTPTGHITFDVTSDYPAYGSATIHTTEIFGKVPPDFTLSFRVPAFAMNYVLRTCYDGRVEAEYTSDGGCYLTITPEVLAERDFCVDFDIPVVMHNAPHGSDRAGDNFVAFTYGSVVLTRDSRDGAHPLTPLEVKDVENFEVIPSAYGGFLGAKLCMGQTLTMTDYMSAGNGWDGGSFATWLPKTNS